ncbi:MAG: HAD family phosphatase [Victivallales bacterium]|nr:HAD family phosphatase [Victivallales bacterium]
MKGGFFTMRQLDLSRYKAFLFDFDNTLVATEQFHVRAFARAIHDMLGYDMLEEDYLDFVGNTSMWLAEKILKRLGRTDVTPWDVTVLKRRYTEEDFRAIVYPGVPEFLHKYKGQKILSLATNSPHVFIDMALERANLTGIMDFVVTGDDAKRFKPKPDIFLLAARTVGLPVEECLAFEDSETGLQAAKAAGMDTVMVANPGNTIPNVIPIDVWIFTWPQLLAL